MKKFSCIGLIIGVGLLFIIAGIGCKKAEQSVETPKPAVQAQDPVAATGLRTFNGTLEKGGIGLVLSAEKDKTAVTLKKTATAFKNVLTVKGQMKTALPAGIRNGYIAFGDTPVFKELTKAGILIGSMKYVIEGSSVERVEVPQKVDQIKVFDVELTVNLKEKTVAWKIDGKEVKTKFKKTPSSINYIGYVAVNTKTEFSELQISGE